MRIYALAIGAWRTSRQDIESDVKVAIVEAKSEHEARQKGRQIALHAFPDSEQWFDRRVNTMEISQGMQINSYRLTWQVEKIN